MRIATVGGAATIPQQRARACKWLGLALVALFGLGLQAAETTNTGYLSKSAPSPLRFAPAQKPRPSSLPSLPVTRDPQPVHPLEVAVAKAQAGQMGIELTVQSGPANSGAPTTSESVIDRTALTPQALVRFFAGGKPGGTELYFNEPTLFQVPVRNPIRASSSASYSVK